MSNLGITISFIIGGLLILSILTLNGRVVQNSGETVLNMSAKQTVENVTEIMRLDFQRMGYNMASGTNVAIKDDFTGKKITFLADIDNDKATTATEITWKFTNKEYKPTENDNDRKLIRKIDGTVTTVFPVTYDDWSEPNFVYRDKDNNVVIPGIDPASKIRSISVELWTQSPARYGNNDYSTSFWEKTFTPPNLSLQDMEW